MWWLNKIKHIKVLEQPDSKWSLDKCHYHLLPVIESTLEKASQSKLRSPYKEFRPVSCKFRAVHPEGNKPRIFIGRTVAEAEAPILWPPDVKSQLVGNDPHAGKDWKQEEKGMTEDEMFGWHHWLNGHESEQTLGVGDGQGSLTCCSPWGRRESDTTEQLNWTDRRGQDSAGIN